MIGTTAVVLDSASYLPQSVIERFGAIVVPLTSVVDGVAYREFVDLGADEFYTRLAAGAKVSTSQPPPGRFLEAYAQAKAAGAERIVSIHIGSGLSGTLNSARIAAEMADIPVHLIDTAQASFIEGLCAWEAMEALEAGASIDSVWALVERTAAAAGNVFIVRGLELLRQGGRMTGAPEQAAVPILALIDGAIRPIGSAQSVDEALDGIVAHVRAAIAASPSAAFRIGISNGAADDLAGLLEARIRGLAPTAEVMQYGIGPVIGAHTGPGCTGAVFLARPV